MVWTVDVVKEQCPYARTLAMRRRWCAVANALNRKGYLNSYQIDAANDAVHRMIMRSIARRSPKPVQLTLPF